MLNAYDDIYAERFVLTNLAGEETEPFSIETRTPLSKFDLLLASIHYEADYVNLARLLLSSGVPLRASTRGRSRPLVVVGGPAPTGNPAPLSGLADVIVVGEAETTLPKFLDAVFSGYPDKRRILDSLSGDDDFYVSNRREKVKRAWIRDLNSGFHPLVQIQPLDEEPIFGRGFFIEESRGCPYRCLFCSVSRIFKPFRYRDAGLLKELMAKGCSFNRVKKVIFYSPCFFAHPRSDDILSYAVDDLRVGISIPSLRVDMVSEDRLGLITKGGQRVVTLAPETGSERVGKAIKKYFTEKDVMRAIKIAGKSGVKRVKLYFRVGFPGERPDDLRATVDLAKKAVKSARAGNIGVHISVNPLIPKAQTPMQWFGMDRLEVAVNKLKLFRRELGRGATVTGLNPHWAHIEGVIGLRGGRSVS